MTQPETMSMNMSTKSVKKTLLHASAGSGVYARRRAARPARRGNAMILVTGVLVLLVIIATAYVTRTQTGRVTSVAAQRLTERQPIGDRIGGDIADMIRDHLFVQLVDPALYAPGEIASSNDPRLPIRPDAVRFGRDNFDENGDGVIDHPYNFPPFEVRAATNVPDFTTPALNLTLPDEPGNPGFADTRWLASSEPWRIDFGDVANHYGYTDTFVYWPHLTYLGSADNSWRLVADISDVENSVITNLNLPVEQFGLFDWDNPNFNFTGEYPVPAGTADIYGASGFTGTFNITQFNNLWDNWFTTFQAPSPQQWEIAAAAGPSFMPPNYFYLPDLDADWTYFENGERQEDAFIRGAPRWHVERRLADADGDGATDSFWWVVPFSASPGVRHIVAARVIDNAGMVNVNAAGRFVRRDPIPNDPAAPAASNIDPTLRYRTVGATPLDLALIGRLDDLATSIGFNPAESVFGVIDTEVGIFDNEDHHGAAIQPGGPPSLSGGFLGNVFQWPELSNHPPVFGNSGPGNPVRWHQPQEDFVPLWNSYIDPSGRPNNLMTALGIQETDGATWNRVLRFAPYVFDSGTPDFMAFGRNREIYWRNYARFYDGDTSGIDDFRPFGIADELELRMFAGNNYPFVLSRFERAMAPNPYYYDQMDALNGGGDLLRTATNREESNAFLAQLTTREMVHDLRHRLTFVSNTRNEAMPPWMWLGDVGQTPFTRLRLKADLQQNFGATDEIIFWAENPPNGVAPRGAQRALFRWKERASFEEDARRRMQRAFVSRFGASTESYFEGDDVQSTRMATAMSRNLAEYADYDTTPLFGPPSVAVLAALDSALFDESGDTTCAISGNACLSASPNNTAGCADNSCCETVCLVDPFCCETVWDQSCADIASANCFNAAPTGACCFDGYVVTGAPEWWCEAEGGVFNGACNERVDFLSAEGQPFITEVYIGHHINPAELTRIIANPTDKVNYLGETQDIFGGGDTTPCGTAVVAVQIANPYARTFGIRGQANAVCDPATAGDCFAANGSPGCDLFDCCEFICDQDPFCCETDWDAICAAAANKECLALVNGEDLIRVEDYAIRVFGRQYNLEDALALAEPPDPTLPHADHGYDPELGAAKAPPPVLTVLLIDSECGLSSTELDEWRARLRLDFDDPSLVVLTASDTDLSNDAEDYFETSILPSPANYDPPNDLTPAPAEFEPTVDETDAAAESGVELLRRVKYLRWQDTGADGVVSLGELEAALTSGVEESWFLVDRLRTYVGDEEYAGESVIRALRGPSSVGFLEGPFNPVVFQGLENDATPVLDEPAYGMFDIDEAENGMPIDRLSNGYRYMYDLGVVPAILRPNEYDLDSEVAESLLCEMVIRRRWARDVDNDGRFGPGEISPRYVFAEQEIVGPVWYYEMPSGDRIVQWKGWEEFPDTVLPWNGRRAAIITEAEFDDGIEAFRPTLHVWQSSGGGADDPLAKGFGNEPGLDFPFQMLMKNAPIDQAGEIYNVFTWGHMFEFPAGEGPSAPGDVNWDTSDVRFRPTRTFSEHLADERYSSVNPDIDDATQAVRAGRLLTLPKTVDSAEHNNVIGAADPLQPDIPSAARLADAFVCDGLYRLGQRGESRGTPGLLNLNTASIEALRGLPSFSRMVRENIRVDMNGNGTVQSGENTPYTRSRIAEGIHMYNWLDGKNPDNPAEDYRPDYREREDIATGLRRTRGFKSVGELQLITQSGAAPNPPVNTGEHTFNESFRIDFAGLGPYREGAGFSDNIEARLSTDVVRPLVPAAGGVLRESPDHVAGDAEEANLLFAGVSNLVTTRSDTFTVYFRVRTFRQNPETGVWDATDRDQIVDDTRYVMLIDRSEVDSPGDEARILYLEEIPD